MAEYLNKDDFTIDLQSFSKALKEKESQQLRLLQKFFALCLVLILFGIGLLIYFLNYLTQFDPDKIDSLLNQNLLNQRQAQSYILPPIALESISTSDQKLRWSSIKDRWTFKDGSRKNLVYNNQYCLVAKNHLDQLKAQHGIFWDGTKWNHPDKFAYLFEQNSSD